MSSVTQQIPNFKLGISELPDELKAPGQVVDLNNGCLLYTSPSPRDRQKSRMPSSA